MNVFFQWLELLLILPVVWAAYRGGLRGGVFMALGLALLDVFFHLSTTWPQDPAWEVGIPYWVLYLGIALFLGGLVEFDRFSRQKIKNLASSNSFPGELDSVTQSYHRRYMEAALWRHWETARNQGNGFSLLLLDLNQFHKLNREHGSLAGDRVLRSTVLTIFNNVRQSDVVGRFGEDQFLVILPKCSEKNAIELGKRLRQEMAKLTFSDPQKSFKADFSVGVVQYLSDFKDLPEMIRQLSTSLHREKQKLISGAKAS